MRIRSVFVACVILIFAIIILGNFGWRYMMNQPENIPHCRFFTKFDMDTFEENWVRANTSITPITNTKYVDLILSLNIPFRPDKKDRLIVGASVGAYPSDYTFYNDLAKQSSTISIRFPLRGEWPDGGYLDFTLLMPEKKAVCVWGGEELLLLEDPDHPRNFNIELLPDVYVDETGGRRRTIITPME